MFAIQRKTAVLAAKPHFAGFLNWGYILMIELKKAVKTYENGEIGLAGVDLTIEKGEFAFVVGTSGSGKTSLIRLLLKESVLTSGQILVDGVDISTITRRQLPSYRRKMGVVFQDFRLLDNKTVFENVAFAMQIVEASNREIRRTVPQVLGLVGLAKKAKAYPNQLSGGEKQRTALARAIVNRPPLLIADEPTGNLDPDTAWEIMTLLEDINTYGTTVLVATHAHDIVDDMQKRVIALKNGLLIGDAENSGYMHPADHQDILADITRSSHSKPAADATLATAMLATANEVTENES